MINISFGSDNHSGAHPAILEAILKANEGYFHGYGEDDFSEDVLRQIAALFGKSAHAHMVMTGSAANVLSLQSLIKSYQAVLCAESAHINVHEAGAVQKFTQARLMVIPSTDGKLYPEQVLPYITGFGDQHMSQPRILSITQSTEYGTLYELNELQALAELAHSHDLLLHIDGARLANAAVSLGCTLQQMTADIGADIVSFGGTKNGLLLGEAVIFLTQHDKMPDFIYYRKQAMQLLSKMRWLNAQWLAYIQDDLWAKCALQANEAASYFAHRLSRIPGVTITQPVRVNAVFAILPRAWIAPLYAKYHFYTWNESRDEVRLMCSFNTTHAMIDEFIDDIYKL